MYRFLCCLLITVYGCLVVPGEVANAQRPRGNPYRARETFTIVFELTKAESRVNQHPASVCEVDLLMLENIQEDLKLSSSTIKNIKTNFKPYLKLVFEIAVKNRKNPKEVDETERKEIDDAKQEILRSLNARAKRRLIELDRYLFVRRFGPTKFLDVFFPERLLTDVQKRKLSESEDRLRTQAYQEAEERWRETLEDVRSRLDDTPDIQKKFGEQVKTFQSSLFADICLVDLEFSNNEKIKSNGDPDDEFLDKLQRKVQLTMGFDGNWEYQVMRDDSWIYDNFSYLCTKMWTNPFRSELGNDLDLLEYQAGELSELRYSYLREVNRLTKEKKDGVIDANEHKRLKTELSIPVVEAIFNDVMLPHQRSHLEMVLNQQRMMIAGPARLLLLESISEDVRDEIRNDFEEFRDALINIEKQTQREYIELIQEYAGSRIGFDSESRPKHLVPSHVLLRPKKTESWRTEPD